MPQDDRQALNENESPNLTDTDTTNTEAEDQGTVGDERQHEANADTSLNTSDDNTEDEDNGPVPYARFREVNGKFRELEKTALPKAKQLDEVLEFLGPQVPGFKEAIAAGQSPREFLERAIAENARQQERQQQTQTAIQQSLAKDHAAIDAAVQAGDMSPEWGEYNKQLATQAAYARPAIEETQAAQVRQRVDSIASQLTTEFPDADADTIRDYIAAGNLDGARARAKAQQERFDRIRAEGDAKAQRAVADYQVQSAKRGETPQVERGRGATPSAKPTEADRIAKMTDKEFMAYMAEQGRKTDANRS